MQTNAPIASKPARNNSESVSLRLKVSPTLYKALLERTKALGLKENDLIRFYLSERLLQKDLQK